MEQLFPNEHSALSANNRWQQCWQQPVCAQSCCHWDNRFGYRCHNGWGCCSCVIDELPDPLPLPIWVRWSSHGRDKVLAVRRQERGIKLTDISPSQCDGVQSARN